jgi:hypothetical protein
MRFARRVSVALSSALLLQLTLQGAAVACVSPVAGVHRETQHPATAAMEMTRSASARAVHSLGAANPCGSC